MTIHRAWMQPFNIKAEDEKMNIIPSRGFKLIGERFYRYDGTDGEKERKAKCIQKSLYGRDEWFYFNKGFNIEETNGSISVIHVDDDAFDADNLLYSDQGGVRISVNAIVGANGTGKSTLVDTIIRLINNMSAAIIGEKYVYSSAQHLHYIDNVYASLAIYRDNEIKVLTCKGRRLELTTYQTDVDALVQQNDNDGMPNVEHYVPKSTNVILDGNTSEEEVLPPQKGVRGLLNDWFYTLVSNYSLYAYNYRDYIYEQTNTKLHEKLNDEYFDYELEENESWLNGIFCQNDGYSLPISIHPMRRFGYIETQNVNYIGKQNLISLCFEQIGDDFPFRIINQTHHIVAFTFKMRHQDDHCNFYGFCLDKYKHDTDEENHKLLEAEVIVRQLWKEAISAELLDKENDDINSEAWRYLMYETIKVIWTYEPYKELRKLDFSNEFDRNNLKDNFHQLLRDNSYRTVDIRRAVAFIRFSNESKYYLRFNSMIDVDRVYNWMMTVQGMQLYPNHDYHKINIEDLLPPPFVDVAVQLVDNEHLDKYICNKCTYNDIIPFEGLSSGERQIAYTIGDILCHLKNIESGCEDGNISIEHVTTLKYNYVNLMLDEVELYFHPDLQRRFVSLLLDSIKGLQLKNIYGINITCVTHSPFVLSDIPSSNVLCLSRELTQSTLDKTFAANIHDLFNTTFILPYTIGEYAQRKIVELIDTYHSICIKHDSSQWKYKIDGNSIEEKLSRMKYLSEIIGDRYLSDEVKDMEEEIEDWWQNKGNKHEAD